MLTFRIVQEFSHAWNPCDFRPYYAEDCSYCMNEFCKQYSTNREEYRRKKASLQVLQSRIGILKGTILVTLRKNPKSSLVVGMAEEMNALEKELEIN